MADWQPAHPEKHEPGLCECGCGEPTRLSAQARPERSQKIGDPVRFVKGHNGRKYKTGEIPMCPRGHGPLYQRTATQRAQGWRWACKECNRINERARRFRVEYGITLDEYDVLTESQHGVCAICKQPESHKQNKQLSVDHNHVTGKIRELLCANCNIAIGMLREDPELARKVADYLEKHG